MSHIKTEADLKAFIVKLVAHKFNVAEKDVSMKHVRFLKFHTFNFLSAIFQQVHPESRFLEDLGLDSLDSVENCFEVEEAFGIQISEEEINKALTVEKLTNLVAVKLKIVGHRWFSSC